MCCTSEIPIKDILSTAVIQFRTVCYAEVKEYHQSPVSREEFKKKLCMVFSTEEWMFF